MGFIFGVFVGLITGIALTVRAQDRMKKKRQKLNKPVEYKIPRY
jgi:hypothetical protein